MIYISNDAEDRVRLKKYSSTSCGEKSLLKIEIEIDDPFHLAHLLRNLGDLTRAQKQAAKPKTPRQLALPAPEASS